jgi:hypothetical protein
MNTTFDVMSFLIAWETEEITFEEEVRGFQELLDRHLMPGLQGCYHRRALELIEQGLLVLPEPEDTNHEVL